MKYHLSLIAIAWLSLNAVSQTPQKAIERLAEKHKEASFGFYSKNIVTGEVLAAFNAEKNRTPASSLKFLTTATALEILGSNFQYKTTAYLQGEIRANTLYGNVIIKPSGDPSLGSNYLGTEQLYELAFGPFVDAIKDKGISEISGQLILDMRGFESERAPGTWTYEDLGNYFGASVSPLNLGDNRLEITFSSGEVGSQTQIKSLEPQVSGLSFDNQVMASTISYDNAYIYGSPQQNKRQIRGQIPANKQAFTIKGSVPNPELFAMQLLTQRLRNEGIALGDGAVSFSAENVVYEDCEKLSEITSPPLSELVRICNMESHNLFAEAFLRTIGKEKTGMWSRKEGLEALETYWQIQKIDIDKSNLHDGSGLSHYNGISAKTLAAVAEHMLSSKHKAIFLSSLPVAGKTGSLQYFLSNTAAVGKLRAKSGYLSGVRSYTGYTKTATGDVAVFCIMVNQYSDKASLIKRELAKVLLSLSQ